MGIRGLLKVPFPSQRVFAGGEGGESRLGTPRRAGRSADLRPAGSRPGGQRPRSPGATPQARIPGQAGRRNPPQNVTCRFKAFLFCFVVLFFRAASQARGAGKGARAGGPSAAAPVGRAQGGVSYSPPEPPPASAKPVEQFPPVAGRRAGGRREERGREETRRLGTGLSFSTC